MRNGTQIGDTFAIAVPADEGHIRLADNISPHLGWTDVRDGTGSLAITCIDAHCPSSPADVTYSLNPSLR